MLPLTIPTICGQDYPDLTCILIDDQSDDDSPSVIGKLMQEHGNLRVIHGQERPKGWMGKCWAVKQGADLANLDRRDKLLLFTDADIVYHPQAVKQAVKFLLANDYDAVSLIPRCTFGEKIEAIGLAGFLTLLTCMFPIGWINDPKKKTLALAAGGFILFRKSSYEAVGGHEAVKHHIIEDINLAKLMKQKEMKIHTRFTQDLLTTRMYEGFDDMWEGLTKNAYAGMDILAGTVHRGNDCRTNSSTSCRQCICFVRFVDCVVDKHTLHSRARRMSDYECVNGRHSFPDDPIHAAARLSQPADAVTRRALRCHRPQQRFPALLSRRKYMEGTTV